MDTAADTRHSRSPDRRLLILPSYAHGSIPGRSDRYIFHRNRLLHDIQRHCLQGVRISVSTSYAVIHDGYLIFITLLPLQTDTDSQGEHGGSADFSGSHFGLMDIASALRFILTANI